MKGILFLNTEIFQNDSVYKKAFSLISDDRKEKIKKIKSPMPARLSLGAGLLTRIAMDQCNLGERINDIEYRKHGKPYLNHTNFHFNLSHSCHYVVCAYADEAIGIDLQRIKKDIPKHTRKILSSEEIEYLDTLKEDEKIIAFYQLWSRKESLIKWDGRGLHIPLSSISFINQGQLETSVYFEGEKLYISEFDLWLPDYTFCICSQKESFPENIMEVTAEFLTKY